MDINKYNITLYNIMNDDKKTLKLINFEDLIVGLRVQNSEMCIGTIMDCEDIHNIMVEYDNGGYGIHCLIKDCKEHILVNDTMVEIEQYDALYYI